MKLAKCLAIRFALAVSRFRFAVGTGRFNQCITPAMPAGMTDRIWGIYDIVATLENWESQP